MTDVSAETDGTVPPPKSTPTVSPAPAPAPVPADSPASGVEAEKAPDNTDHTLPKRPWRRYVTPWERIIAHHYEGEGTDERPRVVDWLPDDPENPMLWGNVYKWLVVITLALSTMAVAFASSCLSGSTASIAQSFGPYADQVYVMVTSGFVLGFVVGPLLWAPMSELFGRRNLFIFSYVLFVIFNGAVVASQNIWTLVILRFLAGTAGSSPLTNAGGTVSDVFNAQQRGLGMAIFAAAPFLGPSLGPAVGGFLGDAGGWRWVAALLALFAAAITLLGALFVPESYAPVLLRQRADLLTRTTGRVHRSKYEKERPLQLGANFKVALSRPWMLLFREPIVFLLSVYMALIYATLYMLFGAFPIVFQEQRGWSAGVSGLAFLGVLIGFILADLWIIFIENPRYSRKLARERWLAPEERLISAILGAVLLPIGLFSFAWTAAPASIPWIAPIVCSAPFGLGMVLVFLSIFNYLIDAYLLYAASVLAAVSVLRSIFAVGFPLFVEPMFRNLGINWACTLIAFLALACVPLPVLFYIWGRRIRVKTKFGREADELGQKMRDAVLKPGAAA